MNDGITWVGLDAHKKFINVAVLLPAESGVREWRVENTAKKVKHLARRLIRLAPGEARACYEAGPCGFALQRQLENEGLVCEVIAPSLIPVKPGDRVKTDRRDARKLADLLRSDMLTAVHPPTPEEESARDLYRCREATRDNLGRARHRLAKFLLRRGIVFSHKKKKWTRDYHRWLRRLVFDNPIAQRVFDEYLGAVEYNEERLKGLDDELEALAQTDPYREPVGWLRCFHGIDTVTAVGIVTEIYDIRRFPSPRELMSYLGLVPSEDTSGDKPRKGPITKAGNRRVRRLLTEAAWHYRHSPRVGRALRKRRERQPQRVIAIADKARLRLSRRHHRLIRRGKHPNKATTAVARELAGFIWAALREMNNG